MIASELSPGADPGHPSHFHFDPSLCLQAEEAAQGFAALGSPARLQVLASLVKAGPQGLSVGQIEARCGIKGSTLAHHLRALVTAGLAEQNKHGRSVLTSARYSQLEALAAYILHECCAEPPGEGADKDPVALDQGATTS